LLSKDIEIPVIGTNFVKNILWPAPLIEHLLNQAFVSLSRKRTGLFLFFPEYQVDCRKK